MMQKEAKKLLVLSDCFYPSKKRGGPTVSVTNMVTLLSESFDTSVLTTIYEMGHKEKYTNVSPGKNRLFGADVYYLEDTGMRNVYNTIRKIAPDIIYVSSFFSAGFTVPALMYHRINKNVRLIIAPRGEFIRTSFNIKKKKKLIYLNALKAAGMLKNIAYQVTSDKEYSEIQYFFKNAEVYKISNLSTMNGKEIIRPDKKPGAALFVTVGRIHPIKNVLMDIELIGKLKGDITFDIYGSEEDLQYLEKCRSAASVLPKNIKINFKGVVSHDKIGKLYSKYHYFISMTQTENYGHAIVEAMRNKCPVIISSNTPWTDVNECGGGFAYLTDNKEQIIKKLQQLVDSPELEFEKMCNSVYEYALTKQKENECIDRYIDMLSKPKE